MIASLNRRFLHLAAALAAMTVLSTPPAGAQNLFERFFAPQGHYEYRRVDRDRDPRRYEYDRRYHQRRAMPPEMQQQRPRPKPKINQVKAPSYYQYKTDALKPVAFSAMLASLRAAPAEGDIAEGEVDAAFIADIERLQGFELLAEKEVAEALQKFYAEHRGLLWLDGDRPNQRAIAAVRTLAEADSYGLDAADYSVSPPDRMAGRDEAMRFEMMLSARLLRYVGDAHNGRVVADRLSGYHDLPLKPLDRVAVLKTLAGSVDVASYLESFHPQSEQYRALRKQLEVLRASPDREVAVPADTLIKPGQTHPALPDILALIEEKSDAAFRERYGAIMDAHRGSTFYGEELVPVIKAAQQAHGLAADGIVGRRTVATLAGESRSSMINKVLLALERMRWLPKELGDTYVFINQPAFRVTYVADGEERLSMRAIIGSKSNQTAFFYDRIQQVDFNPYWGVPQSILVNEMLPRLYNDPGYLDRAGYEVFHNGRRIASASVNWWQYSGKLPFDVRQKPGPDNALGELKILFPNKHAIYMHDTPAKNLFSRDSRAFSHGCVRLEDPRGMAAAVLGWTREQVAERIARGHSSTKVENQIPVYVAYFTAWPEANGEIGFHDDVYERDAHLLRAIELTTSSRQAGA